MVDVSREPQAGIRTPLVSSQDQLSVIDLELDEAKTGSLIALCIRCAQEQNVVLAISSFTIDFSNQLGMS